jgi:hypothetical protein
MNSRLGPNLLREPLAVGRESHSEGHDLPVFEIQDTVLFSNGYEGHDIFPSFAVAVFGSSCGPREVGSHGVSNNLELDFNPTDAGG